jgi:hypothetical protein
MKKRTITRFVAAVAAAAFTAGALLVPASSAQAMDTDWPVARTTPQLVTTP